MKSEFVHMMRAFATLILFVQALAPPEIRGAQAISVGVGDFDLPNLQIRMQAWHEVTGRVVIEGTGTMPEFISFRLERPTKPTSRNASVSISSGILERIPTARDPWRIVDWKPTRGLSAAFNEGRAETIEGSLGPGTAVVMPVEALSRNARLKPDGRFTVRLPESEWQLGPGSTSVPGYVLTAGTYGRRDILKDHLLVGGDNTAELVFRFKRQ